MVTKKPKSEQEKKIVRVISQRGLNVRAGPHQVFHSLQVLKEGELLEVVDLPTGVDFPGWAFVQRGDGDTDVIGWVSTDYITEV